MSKTERSKLSQELLLALVSLTFEIEFRSKTSNIPYVITASFHFDNLILMLMLSIRPCYLSLSYFHELVSGIDLN